ncbi:MAG TPA: carboxypeptidase regulatory-like domain-containing protein, partial [Terriglobales bacterium]
MSRAIASQRLINKTVSCLLRIFLISGLLAGSASAQQITISGVVQDATGAAIPGAQVTLTANGASQTATTNSEGKFSVSVMSGAPVIVRVSANGFAPAEKTWTASAEQAPLTFVLRGVAQGERIVVSATRTELKLSEVPGSAVELSPEDLDANAGLTLDDVLRQVPGFSLFRRSSSRVANPTTQGVSLRGLGA